MRTRILVLLSLTLALGAGCDADSSSSGDRAAAADEEEEGTPARQTWTCTVKGPTDATLVKSFKIKVDGLDDFDFIPKSATGTLVANDELDFEPTFNLDEVSVAGGITTVIIATSDFFDGFHNEEMTVFLHAADTPEATIAYVLDSDIGEFVDHFSCKMKQTSL
jgi:hypothetical protein